VTWRPQNASLAALIKQRLAIDVVLTPGRTGPFDVIANGETIAHRGGNWMRMFEKVWG